MSERATERRDQPAAPVGFRDVLRVPAFLAMYIAETQSSVGDQLARVALSVLVYSDTNSAAATALTYALTFLPTIVGGGLLSGLADRYSRTRVMVCVDALRAALLAAMTIPGLPIGGLFALLVVAVFLGPAFTSAEVSLIASIFDTDRYRVATGLRLITKQLAQVAGFAVGGALVAVIGPHWTLGVDAATFLVSALIVGIWAGGRRIRAAGAHSDRGEGLSVGASVRALWQDRPLRVLVSLSWLAAFFVVPEGLAVPYAKQIGGGSSAVGVLLASIPLGSVVGVFLVLRRVRPERRAALIGPLAMLAGLPLIGCASDPALGISLTLWFLSGVFAAYQVETLTMVVRAIPAAWRGRGIGLIGAGLTAVQGIGLIAFGLIAQGIGPGPAIAIAGATGSVLATVIWLARGNVTEIIGETQDGDLPPPAISAA